MATIKDVAQASGVSTATVSYILNNRPGNFAPATRQRVLRVMRELNYRPSARYQSRGTHTVGVVYPQPEGKSFFGSPYYGVILDGLLSHTTSCHWHLTLFSEAAWDDARRSLRVYCDGRVEGLILIGLDPQDAMVTALHERGIPFVLINSGSEFPDICSVDVDNTRAAFQITTHLLQRGHRRIALLPGNASHDGSRQRIRGALDAMECFSVSCPPEWIPEGAYSKESGYARTRALFEGSLPYPTALFCASDYIARGAYQALKEKGLSIPDAVSVVSFDDLDFAAQMEPPLTTMRQPLQKLGVEAAKILLARIEAAPERDAETKIVLPAQLIERASVAPPAAA